MIDENKPPYTKMKLPKVSRFRSLALIGHYIFMGVGFMGVGFYIARATAECGAAVLSAGDGNTTEVPLTTPRTAERGAAVLSAGDGNTTEVPLTTPRTAERGAAVLPAGDGNTTEVPLTTPRTTLPLTDEEKINLQENKLRSIGCEPKPVKEKIVRYLKYHDELADREFYPEVFTVNRCLENSSFCGDPRLGKSYGPCLPDSGAIKQLSVSVFYYEGRKKLFKEVLVPEHTACKCPNK